jgi:hypothetical protein
VRSSPQIVWVCAKCIGKPRPPHNFKDFVFVSSTSRSIDGHLKKSYRVSNVPTPAGQPQKAQAADAQLTLYETAGVSTSDPEHQATLARIKRMYDPNVADVLLLKWLAGGNVPFAIARSPRFRRLLKYINSLTSVPSIRLWLIWSPENISELFPALSRFCRLRKNGALHLRCLDLSPEYLVLRDPRTLGKPGLETTYHSSRATTAAESPHRRRTCRRNKDCDEIFWC